MSKDYGGAVSQKGYDVKTCADRFLVYSSAFQTLKVFSVSSVTGTIPVSITNTITITHNLGYLSPFFVVYNGSSTIGQENSYLNSDGGGNELIVGNYENKLELSISRRFDLVSGSQVGDTVYFTIYIFLEDFSTIEQNTINTSTSSGSSPNDYGIRISKEGYDVKDCTDEQCVLSSSLFTQIIHKKDIFQTPADIRANFTVNASTDVFTSSGHGLSNGSILELDSSDTLPAPLSDSIDYYVIDVTTNTFKVSLTEGGSAVNITNTGVGTHDFRTLTPLITHDLGYPPAYLLYELQDDGSGEYLEIYDTGIDDEKIDISKYATDETYYYIIFKQKND